MADLNVAPGETKPCPLCAEPIQAAAIKCKHCGEMISTTGGPIHFVTATPKKLIFRWAPVDPQAVAARRHTLRKRVVVLSLAAIILSLPLVVLEVKKHGPKPDGSSLTGCQRYAVLVSPASIAADLGKTADWVRENHRINLWSLESKRGKGSKVGETLPGSFAVVLDEGPDDYRIRSGFDGSTGWIGKVQVERVLNRDASSGRPCEPSR